MVKIPAPDAMTELMNDLKHELGDRLKLLREIEQRVSQLHNNTAEARVRKLRERAERLIAIAKLDDGELINPDLEYVVGYLEDEGIPDLSEESDELEGIFERMTANYEARLESLKDVIDNTPDDAFVYTHTGDGDADEEDEEGGEGAEDPHTEAEMRALVREWKQSHGAETAEIFEIRARMKTGIGAAR